MRDTLYHNLGTKLTVDDVYSSIAGLGWVKDDNTTNEVYLFRNDSYHLKVVPRKTRIELHLHKDVVFLEHHKTIVKGSDIREEFKKVKLVLEDMLKNKEFAN